MIVPAGGVAPDATNVYLTTSLLPSAIGEIGGEQFGRGIQWSCSAW